MAYDTVVDKIKLEAAITATADAIRAKTGGTGLITWDTSKGFADAVAGLTGGAAEIIAHADIPSYVKAEAIRVAQKVESVRKEDSIVFLAMSDNHHYGAQADATQYPDANGIQTDVSNLHAAMAAKILAYALDFDFMAQLGDVSFGNAQTTSALLQSQADELLSFIRESHEGIPCFHAIGNHDTGIYYHNAMIDAGNTGVYTESAEWLYNHFTALSASDDTVFGGVANGGYCYRDFADKKLRVFLLNTSEALTVNQQDKATLGSQRKWLADALVNLGSKTDAAKWSFIVLSHYPADYGNAMPLSELLKAYVTGGSITIALESGTNTTVSFAGKNAPKMIAQFHGHVHNFLVSKLYSYATGSGVQYDAWRICIPNGQYNRENYYTTVGSYTDINFAQAVTYGKSPDTAKDTSFVVNVINPSEKMIHSICYGAGIDRVVGYGDTVYYAVNTKLSNVTLNGSATAAENQAYTASLILPDNYKMILARVTMDDVDITSSVYSDGNINIPNVTGNISITASAVAITDYTNQIPISVDENGNIYNDIGYKGGVYLTSAGIEEARASSYNTGFIPCKSGTNYVVRMKNVTFNKDASDKTYHRLTIYDASKNFLVQINAGSTGAAYGTVTDADGNWTQFSVRPTTSGVDVSGMAYFRISAGYIGDDSVITVNEPIE